MSDYKEVRSILDGILSEDIPTVSSEFSPEQWVKIEHALSECTIDGQNVPLEAWNIIITTISSNEATLTLKKDEHTRT